ncbi:MAG: hypothetical protein RLZ98_2508 [Pseudomonadota bacterium]|jgi:DNA repair protein RadA/Sms
MAKQPKSLYVCQSCGGVSNRWVGKCPECGDWNTLTEEAGTAALATQPGTGLSGAKRGRAVTLEALATDVAPPSRISTGITELDRVTGGGVVPGSAILIGGEPGIGKSTLLLQLTANFANAGQRALYFSGEEATAQVRLRAERLGLANAPVALAAETNLANILATLSTERSPALVVVDSIQTLWTDGLDAAPGTVSQVRAASQLLIRYAKQTGTAVILVGHVTKEGQIAGPKVVEHMVDTVLYFEGDGGHPYRILRGIKNRFGATDEIGVFEMTASGLAEVANPSELFLGDRDEATPGSAVYAGIEGTRPILVEMQALVAPSPLGTPRRTVVGWDTSRLAMVLAVLEARCGVQISQNDIYLNVAGGMRISEPAADLAAAAALLSSFWNVSLAGDQVYFGEVSLSGAVRPAAHMQARVREAEKLGFRHATCPATGEVDKKTVDMVLGRISHLKQLAEHIHAMRVTHSGV